MVLVAFLPSNTFFLQFTKKKLFWVGGLLRCLQSTFVLSAELLFPFSRQLLSRPTCILPLSSWFYFSKRKKRNVLRASIWQLSCKSDNASLNRRDLVISNRHLPLLISHLEKSNLLLLWEPFRRERCVDEVALTVFSNAAFSLISEKEEPKYLQFFQAH